MEDLEERPDSPPLPRGSYSINFNNLDDTVDPFKPREGLGISTKSPFQSRSKLSCSPPMHSQVLKCNAEFGKDDVKIKRENNMDINGENIATDAENNFEPNTELGNSLSKHSVIPDENPYNSKFKHERSIPKSNDIVEESVFKPKSKLCHSPPRSTALEIDNAESHIQSKVQHEMTDELFQPNVETPHKGTRTKSQTQPTAAVSTEHNVVIDNEGIKDTTQDCASKPVASLLSEKKASPRKSGIKKPKAKSKFKPPPKFSAQNTDEEIVIFSPPSSNPVQINSDISNTTSVASLKDKELHQSYPLSIDIVESSMSQMTVSEVVDKVGGMIDSVHDFGASEMPMENNEEFVTANEAFNDDDSWNVMEKSNHCVSKDYVSANYQQSEGPDRSLSREVADAQIRDHHALDDHDHLMNIPPKKQLAHTVVRHPATRALQDHVNGDGARKDVHIMDKALFMPDRGHDVKPLHGEVGDDRHERYFDAPEYPLAPQLNSQGDNEVHPINAAIKKHIGNSDLNQESIVQLVQVLKYSQSDWNKLKQELELDFNARILNKEREWSKKLADRDKKISYLEEQTLLLRSANEDMKCVVTEFEKTIAQLQAEREKTTTESQQSYEDVVKERDQALDDLQSVETAFSDLHQRYERTKGVVEGFKKNEDTLKKCVQDYQAKLQAADEKIMTVKQQAEEKLTLASDEMEKIRKSTTSDVARLEAALKKSDLKVQGLEKNLEQKIKENSELTAICDELIAKNEENSKRRADGLKNNFYDDCGVWNTNVGTSPKIPYLLWKNGDYKRCFLRNDKYMFENRVSGKQTCTQCDPQPNECDIFMLYRYYSVC